MYLEGTGLGGGEKAAHLQHYLSSFKHAHKSFYDFVSRAVFVGRCVCTTKQSTSVAVTVDESEMWTGRQDTGSKGTRGSARSFVVMDGGRPGDRLLSREQQWRSRRECRNSSCGAGLISGTNHVFWALFTCLLLFFPCPTMVFDYEYIPNARSYDRP